MAFLCNFLPPHCVSPTSHHQNHHISSNYSSIFSIYLTSHHKFNNFNGKNSSFLCLAYSKKTRPSRKLMSDEELCNSLKEFVASVGLPEGHVPSTKKLAEHGRNDLANIVRRRGHKLIADLLANATTPPTGEYDSQENLNEELNGSTDHEEIGQDEKVSDEPAVVTSLVASSESTVYSDKERRFSVESPVSLQEKVENFMKYGQLDAAESNGSFMIGRSVSSPTTEESEIHPSTPSQLNTDFNPEISNETMQGNKTDNEDEINRLKLMLHQKELELSRLKEEIEKEKKELTILQTKAEDEISKAQKLITEKEAELLAAEESLSGLVEAKIQYSGDGETVEVAGSFNGWHQRIQLDQQFSSVIVDPSDSRLPKHWAATLWLYPGVYEMKFVVDGQWKIDPQREITIKNGVENNILRVDR